MSLRKLCHLVALCLFLQLNTLPAAGVLHYGFRQIGSDEGLSASYVKAVAQDSNGFIWIGTKNGLDRYDGVSIKSFNCHDEKAGTGNNNIGSIYVADDNLIWLGTDRGVYVFDPVTESFSFINLSSPEGVRMEDWVMYISGDGNGNVWILIPNQGIFRHSDGKLKYYSVTNHHGDKEKLPLSCVVTKQGNVFVGTNMQGLFYYDPHSDTFRKMNNERGDFDILNYVTSSYLDELPDGRLCIISHNGHIFTADPTERTVNKLLFSRDGKFFPYSLKCVGNEIWVGTSEGVFILSASDNSEHEISRRTMGSHSLSDNTVSCIFVDRDNNVWAGTMFGGVNLIQRFGLVFERYRADSSERGLSSNRVRGMAVDNSGNIWIGTEEAGLNVLNPKTGTVDHLWQSGQNNKITLCVKTFSNNVYAGFGRSGCAVFKNGEYLETLGTSLLQSGNDVYSVLEDSRGNLWMAAAWGLYRRDNGSSQFRKIEDLGDSWILDILEDTTGKIWFASMGDAIWSFNPVSGKFRHYPYDDAHKNGLRTNSISNVFEDSRGTIWFSTDRGGLVRFNPKTDSFITYGIPEGMPDDTSYKIVEDGAGNLWFGTNKGLVRFNPDNEEIKVYSKGLKQFNYNAAVKSADGRMYLGGIDGVITFNPDLDIRSRKETPIFFTDFRMSGTDGSESLPYSIVYTDRIELGPDDGNFSLSIGSPEFTSIGKEEFLYRLLPVNKEWSAVSDPSNLSFAGLQPGKYSLEVKRAGIGDGLVKMLEIDIRPPWYSTWWAFCIYGIILGFAAALLAVYYRRRQLAKLEEKEGIFTIEKEKELYKKKMQFFTEIAHEIRTPLTLIGTPLEAIEDIGVKDNRIQKYLKVIRQNTSRLLDLTGQILDFQKMESESHPLKFEVVEINKLVSEIIERFEMTMSNRNKELTVDIPDTRILANVDKDAVIKILSNLFNNAMKYSERKIEIRLSATDSEFEVTVKSDGEKISGENRYRIFEPFFQAEATKKTDNGGVGIGLPLCRTLARLHDGTIELVDDNEPSCNTFRFALPLNVDLPETDSQVDPVMSEYVLDEESPMSNDNLSYSILLVDDNDEMREFLCDQLSQYFIVETASNGNEALEKMKDAHFDLIVTDIMMPEMDGYELCRQIKADSNHSPVPVVFLTAKNDLESKVKALECGGESYIEKPFSIKYFRQQIKSLLDNRRHERKAFLNKPFFSVDNMKLNKADEEFMSKVIKIINENIDNEEFKVESMADILCMSRSSLLRKIKTLFNLSPIELIRVIRLKKAAELIQDGKYRIGDICFMVGINSQSYFTRLFFKQFGITPKSFEKKCREKQTGDNPKLDTGIEFNADIKI